MSDPSTQPAKSIAHDAVHDLLHFDRKIFRTLPVLLLKPGLLTKKSLEGEQNAFVKPFGLFIFLNFIFFLFKSKGLFNYRLSIYSNQFGRFISQKQKALGLTTEILTERFNTAMHFEEKEYLVLMVPLFAVVLQVLFWRKMKSFSTHFIFSLHFYSFFIILLMVLPLVFVPAQWLVQLFSPGSNVMYSELIFGSVIIAVNIFYLTRAVNLVYGGRRLLNTIKSVLLSISVVLLIAFVYRTLMFFVVMHSISE